MSSANELKGNILVAGGAGLWGITWLRSSYDIHPVT